MGRNEDAAVWVPDPSCERCEGWGVTLLAERCSCVVVHEDCQQTEEDA